MELRENEISYIVRGIVYDIYNNVGPGLLESVYEEIVFYELVKQGLAVERQVEIPIIWDKIKMEKAFRADIIIEEKVILELKSVSELSKVHFKQLSTYMRLTNCRLGLLINFNEIDVQKGIKRIVKDL